MDINKIVNYLNNSEKEYNEYLNNFAKIVIKINEQVNYKIELEDNRPHIYLAVKGLGIGVNITIDSIKSIMASEKLTQEEAVIEIINHTIRKL